MEHDTHPVAQRRLKLEELRRKGFEAYPHRFDYSHTITEIRQRFDGKTNEELDREIEKTFKEK